MAAIKLWFQRWAKWLAAVAILLLALPLIARLAGIGFQLSVLLLEIAGFVLLIVGMPFLAWVIGEAIYRIFIKPYLRVWRIHRIRNARYLQEATERGREGG